MKPQILSLALLLTACGGVEELATEEDALGLNCSTTDDIPNDWRCAVFLFTAPPPLYSVGTGDSDWFSFKTGNTAKVYIFWTNNGTAVTECWFHRRVGLGKVLERQAMPCSVNQLLAANTIYYLEVRAAGPPGRAPLIGTYDFNWIIPSSTGQRDVEYPVPPCPGCTP